ncbi:MAG TPA: hypothetical protein VGO85_09170 [Caldimonas sp.]|nr:hypothetical protein [Caldimonas sp.]
MPNRSCRAVVATALVLVLAAAPVQAQWVPSGELANVLVVHDCSQTAGDVAVSRLDPPTVYLCDTVVRLVRKKDPGAEHFYFVHEFGHIAMATSDEAAADCWAARALAGAPHGGRYLRAAIEHFRARPDDYSRRYGTPNQRAERIRRCAEEARPDGDAIDPAPPASPRRGR